MRNIKQFVKMENNNEHDIINKQYNLWLMVFWMKMNKRI